MTNLATNRSVTCNFVTERGTPARFKSLDCPAWRPLLLSFAPPPVFSIITCCLSGYANRIAYGTGPGLGHHARTISRDLASPTPKPEAFWKVVATGIPICERLRRDA